MYAAVLSGEKSIHVQEVDKPSISNGEVLVKVELCGICGSDLHAYQYPGICPVGTIFGHECAGVVAGVGSSVDHVKVGDRVAVHPAPGCGTCLNCLRGHDNACDELNIGNSLERPGAFAEFVRIARPEHALYKIPDTMSFAEAALIEPLATAFHAVRESHIKSGDCAVVLGCGPIGLAVVQYLKLIGAGKIIVVEISQFGANWPCSWVQTWCLIQSLKGQHWSAKFRVRPAEKGLLSSTNVPGYQRYFRVRLSI